MIGERTGKHGSFCGFPPNLGIRAACRLFMKNADAESGFLGRRAGTEGVVESTTVSLNAEPMRTGLLIRPFSNGGAVCSKCLQKEFSVISADVVLRSGSDCRDFPGHNRPGCRHGGTLPACSASRTANPLPGFGLHPHLIRVDSPEFSCTISRAGSSRAESPDIFQGLA